MKRAKPTMISSGVLSVSPEPDKAYSSVHTVQKTVKKTSMGSAVVLLLHHNKQ